MIAIVSSAPRERAALTHLCESQGWHAVECPTFYAFKRLAARVAPKVTLVRYQLEDGYSDDVIAEAARACRASGRTVVLLPATAASSIEARQVVIGADCVQRDPVRSDVLIAYIEKYLRPAIPLHPLIRALKLDFAGASFDPIDRLLTNRNRSVTLTPKESRLIELLVESANTVVTYETLYSDILGRRFRGDTSNMRVLLGKLAGSLRLAGVRLRDCVEVIPKSGYRYSARVTATA